MAGPARGESPAASRTGHGPAAGAAGPLAGLLVVDLTRVLAGPLASMVLGDLGARVVKVERPGTGDDSRAYGPLRDGRSLYFARVNRGKESVALDLRDDDDRAVLHALLDRADVLVENFRPGVMGRLGLGADDVARRHPRVVYASVSGFGQDGPWSQRPAYDAVVQGLSGIMSITGRPDGPPTKPGIPVADLAGGLFGAIGVLAALRERDRTGRGGRVDVAMLDATVGLLESAALHALVDGVTPPRIGDAHFSIAPFDTFATADDRVVVCAAHDGLFAALAHALRRPDLLADPRFATNAGRHAHREQLTAELERALAAHGADHWLEVLEAAGVPCGPVADVSTALRSEQVAARRMVVRADGLPLPGNPVKSPAWPDPVQRVREPRLDEHGDAWRRELGLPRGPGTRVRPAPRG